MYTRVRLVTALGFLGLAACGDGSGGDPSMGADDSTPASGAEPTDRIGKSRGGLTPLLAEGDMGGTAGSNVGGSGGTNAVGSGGTNAVGTGGTEASGGGGMTSGGTGGGAQAGGAGGSSTTPLPPKPDIEETPANTTVMAKVIKTKLLIADIIYTKQIKLGVARIGEMTESKQDKRYELASGSADINQPTVRATVVYAEDIEADEVQAKQLFAHQIQYF